MSRYRHEFKSQELWSEIKIVLDEFAAPLTELFKKTMDLAKVLKYKTGDTESIPFRA